MVRRDEIEWLRDSLAAAERLLASRGDIAERLAKARERVVWMHRYHMPTKGASAALVTVKAEFEQLRLEPPAKAADLVEDCLRHWRGAS
jgi:hypothetical protein